MSVVVFQNEQHSGIPTPKHRRGRTPFRCRPQSKTAISYIHSCGRASGWSGQFLYLMWTMKAHRLRAHRLVQAHQPWLEDELMSAHRIQKRVRPPANVWACTVQGVLDREPIGLLAKVNVTHLAISM